MIVDASALLAVVLAEPDAPRYAAALAAAGELRMSSVTWFEAAMQVDAGGDEFAVNRFDDFVRDFGIRIIPFTAEHPAMPVSGAVYMVGTIILPGSTSAIAWSMAWLRQSANRCCSRATISRRPISNRH